MKLADIFGKRDLPKGALRTLRSQRGQAAGKRASNAAPLTLADMRANYERQNGTTKLTVRQERALRRKERKASR